MAEQDLGGSPWRELAKRILITALLGIVVYRLGCAIPIPAVSAEAIKAFINPSGGDDNPIKMVLAWANMLNGQAIGQASIFGLGIMPYISASIIMQLLTYSIPSLKALQKEGETGRRKINQFTRYATLVIALVQAAMASWFLSNATASMPGGGEMQLMNADQISKAAFIVQSTLVITTGSMLILWISEQITKFGVGNGVSVVIMIGILSSVPAAFAAMKGSDLTPYLGLILVCLCIIAAIVLVVLAVRRINLEQQRRVQGNKIYGGGQTTLPLKLNQANVIPVIFAQPVMAVVVMAGAGIGAGTVLGYGEPLHRYMMAGLIIGFTFFYISITFDLNDLANNFKQSGFFVRGIKPGKNTVDHLKHILTRITLVGACSLALIALLPETAAGLSGMNADSRGAALMVGGTGLMIVVGVTIDIMQKVATFFLAQQYKGLGAGPGAAPSGKRF